ncbi:leucine-rich repeat and immunoglobulin-like domain-containing nogo receptor-interacting protein 3 isoform X1 [Parasteatoda tepidariorum]|nr:leucine-rich repeat neuronal protein 1 isoform X1 [Parasteatoda tepidariorum]XP_015908168.2 leucine-rich repeat neuronal protein 1 isoform X1 [Parasteatoda tepidariorum]
MSEFTIDANPQSQCKTGFMRTTPGSMAPVLKCVVIIILSISLYNPAASISNHGNCPDKCYCSDMQTLYCENQKLGAFPQGISSSVSNLNLAGNEITDLNYDLKLENLSFLNVSRNHIFSIDSQWLYSLSNLNILDLSNNILNNVQNLRNSALQHLDLSYNKLEVITGFSDMNSLLSLNVSFNEIDTIRNNSFRHFHHLETLDLHSNKIKGLEYEWFTNLQNLHTLNLKNNSLSLVRNLVFSTLKKLQNLDLSNNFIKSVGLLSFKGLINLCFLNLSNNEITVFQSGTFRPLQSLQYIDLSNNKFFKVDGIFIHAKNLKSLYMTHLNHFKNLTPLSLSGLHNLEILDLSHSNLSHIDLKAFSEVQNLRHINLSHANLFSLKMGLFNDLKKVETLQLNGNRWNCDCHIYWLLTWLGEHTNTHLVSPSDTFCSSPSNLKGHVVLDALDLSMVCTNASIHHFTNKTKFKVGLPAFLECQVEGSPLPSLTWLTPQNSALHWNGFWNRSLGEEENNSGYSSSIEEETNKNRFYLMPNGNLAIKSVERGDGGFYVCIASNPLNYASVSIRLTLDYEYFVHIKIISVLVGMATSFGFLLMTLIFVLVQTILKHFGVKWPCRNGNASPRTQQIKKILESMEHYKKQQLDKLRDNYNGQVQRIKDNCMQQMERLRESYSSQAERIRDIKEYGTLQIDRIRDNYYFQVQRVRDYSASQIIRLRENYVFQRNRIRKFSAHHLYKLRENYKVQQQHFNKILENFNIESCRNVCQRTESVIFEPEILESVPKICLQTFAKETCDSNDNSSQISAYFTPEEAGSEVSGHESDDSLDQLPNQDLNLNDDAIVSNGETIV